MIAVVRHSPLRWLLPASTTLFAASYALPASFGIEQLCGDASYQVRLVQIRLMTEAGLITPWSLLTGWIVMTAAMMLPLTSATCARVEHAVVARLRAPAVLLQLAAYVLTWLLPAWFLFPLGLAMAGWGKLGLLFAIAAALAWSASPVAQQARNQMHRPLRQRAFGTGAILDSLRTGALQALPCVVSCWPWMVVPFLAGGAHRPAMVLVAIYLFLDRMASPSMPRWQIPPAFLILMNMPRLRPRLAGT